LEDALAGELANIGVARDQIPATLQLLRERMDTEQRESLRQVDESVNARGLYNSGIRTRDRDVATQGYDRRRQDLALGAAGDFNTLAQQESAARSNYARGLQELLMALAGQEVGREDSTFGNKPFESPSQKTGQKKKATPKKKRKKRGR
jgi:hypothetical protein